MGCGACSAMCRATRDRIIGEAPSRTWVFDPGPNLLPVRPLESQILQTIRARLRWAGSQEANRPGNVRTTRKEKEPAEKWNPVKASAVPIAS